MAETVVKTIENIDELFSQIVVNGEVHQSTRYVPPVATQTQTSSPSQSTQTSTATETSSDTPVRQTQGQDVYGVELNDVLHDFVDQRVTQALEEEVTAREDADTQLQTNIDNEEMARQQADYGLGQRVTAIEEVIPNQATPSNQLADKAFVNSSIATNTANFLGTYTSLADIEAIPNPTNNDYAYLETTDTAGNTLYDRYKYSAEDEQWLFEYELNNSSFTAEQWATINSGLTQSSVSGDIESAIEALDVSAVGGSGKYIKQISQTDGKITAVTGDITSSITSGSNDLVTSGAVADALAGISATDAETAEKLKTARNLKVALGSASAQSFDGSANAESIGVSGTLPVANGGTGQTDLADVTVGRAINGVIGRLGGAFGTSKTTFTELLAEISNASGGGGIVGGSINNVADKDIPAGWHNFLYVPHRSGTGVDNYQYGTLFVTDMTANTSNFWVIHKNSGTVNNAVKIDSRIAEQADYTRGNALCTTDGATQAKVASMRGFVLQSGATFPITFTNANSYNGVITLDVNSTGAKNIYINNAVTSSSNKTLPAGTYLCRYNGSYYYIDTGYFVTNARNANSANSATDTAYLGSGRGAVNGYYIEPSYDSTNNWVKMIGHYGTGSANTRYSCVDVALKIRTSALSSPADGDIWIE